MLYKAIQHLMSFASWSTSEWGIFVLLFVVTVAIACSSVASLLRLILLPFIVIEAYFMTESFACGGSLNMMRRVAGTQNACSPMDYQIYLRSNFGFEHWYTIAAYIGISIFMVWPILAKILNTNKRTLRNNAEMSAIADEFNERMKRIEKI